MTFLQYRFIVLSNLTLPVQAHSVYNMRRIDLLGYEYKETLDHSKWAISDNKPLICIGGTCYVRKVKK